MKLYKEAERLYLEEKLTLDKIAVQLDISRRTIFYWKKKYEWDRKRFETERKQGIFNDKLLDFARKLMQKISKDMDNKTSTPQSEIYSLMNILKNIPQVKQYEISNQKSNQPKPTGQLTPEIIEQIERDILGLDL
jgi:transposase-like protein